MRMMTVLVMIGIVTLIACGPGPLPTLPSSPHASDLDRDRDWFPTDSDDLFPLDVAIAANRIDEVRRLLEKGANPNLRWGQTGDHFPLQEVLDPGGYSMSEPTEAVRLLLEHGGDPNARWCPFESRTFDNSGCVSARGATALTFAAATGRTDVVELLLNAGADPAARDWLGISALDAASSEIGFELISRALFPVVETRDQQALQWLRDNGPFPTDQALYASAIGGGAGWYIYQPSSMSDLRTGYQDRVVERLRILLRLGAKLGDRMDTGFGEWSPLGVALRNGATRAARTLLQAGANVNDRGCLATGYDMHRKEQIFPPCGSGNGTTPLMYAAANGQTDAVKLLLEFKADRTLKNWAGRTALDYAKTPEIRQLLTR